MVGMAEQAARRAARVGVGRVRLWLELAVLYGGAPLAMAWFLGSYSLFGALALLTALGAALLHLTPGFRWRELLAGPVFSEWRTILGFLAVTAVAVAALVYWLVPDRAFALPMRNPRLWLLIMALYPLLSAMPQELLFRVLFFRRYGALFPNRAALIVANGAAFGLAHLLYANPVAIGLTAAGGAVFAWIYARTNSFLLIALLHALAGQAIFTAGLGVYFYHGAVGAAP